MKGLMIKDFNLIKRQGIFILVFVAFFAAVQVGAGNRVMGVAYTTLMISTFSLTTISYDEYENGMPFLFTLPIMRRDYVREKYLFSFIVTMVTWAIMSISTHIVFDVFGKASAENEYLPGNFETYVIFLLITYLWISIELPLQLRFKQNSRVITLGVTIGAVMALTYFMVGYAGEPDLSMQFSGPQMGIFLAGAVLISAILIYLSYRWSIRIMEKREL